MTKEDAQHIAFALLDDAKAERDSLRDPPPGIAEYVQGKILAARILYEKITAAD